MSLPNLGATYPQERQGIAAVQSYAARHRQIFRETPTGDVGIDGQLEFVRPDGAVTGRTLALQIKSGPSYFGHPTPGGWKYYPEAKHRSYWECHPLPVILVLHDPVADRSFWVDARQVLRTPSTATAAYIEVPRGNLLQATSPTALFESAGVQGEAYIDDLEAVIEALLDRRSANPAFPLSFLDLFCGGLTNICRSIYFGTDVAMAIVESNLALRQWEFGWAMGQPEHDFLFDFVKFLVAQHLADVNFSDCLIDLVDREMTPTFVAPLTTRGRSLVRALQAREQALIAEGRMSDGGHARIAQEAFVAVVEASYGTRLARLYEFQALQRPSAAPRSQPAP